jgi:tRNA (guanine26-N2/guanine27-N2)-dimethyltransferase
MDHRLESIPGLIEAEEKWPDVASETAEEGKIEFKIASSESIYDAPAFFNPVMVLNRDLAILFAKLYADKYHPIRIFEPLAGIGIRAFRLALEIPDQVLEVVISDYNEITSAIASYNRYHLAISDKVLQFKREARSLAMDLAERQLRYNFVDLDPFGSPAPFIDFIWPVLQINALVAVTATDMTALCGVYPDSCLRKYGGYPQNNFHTHETASRLLIGLVARSAARHEVGITPILTVSFDHYTKVFFTTHRSRGAANESSKQIGYSYTCQNCMSIKYTPINHNERVSCCGELDQAGPLWIGELFDSEWATYALDNLDDLGLTSHKRIKRSLEEARDSEGLMGYWTMDSLCKHMGTSQPSFAGFFEALSVEGYRVVRSWFTKQAFRTDAPLEVIQHIIKELVS